MSTLYLIDGSSQMYRAYHAIRGLTGPDGRSTNAVFGFVAMLRKLIADHKPDSIAAAFDLAGPTFRDDLLDDYKANRAPMPSDLVEQVPWIHEACAALGVPVLTARGLRGRRRDRDARAEGRAPPATTSPSSPATRTSSSSSAAASASSIRATRARGTTRPASCEKFGVAPDQVIDVLALMGDAVDNVKGVPGIGEKGARELHRAVRLARRAAGRRGHASSRSATARRCWPTPMPRGRAASW